MSFVIPKQEHPPEQSCGCVFSFCVVGMAAVFLLLVLWNSTFFPSRQEREVLILMRSCENPRVIVVGENPELLDDEWESFYCNDAAVIKLPNSAEADELFGRMLKSETINGARAKQ